MHSNNALYLNATISATSGLVEVVLVHGPCSSLHEFILQLLCFFSQLLQLLLLGLNLFVC